MNPPRLVHRAATLAACVLIGSFASADVVVTDPSLPTIGPDVNGVPTGYLTPDMVHAMYSGPGLTLVLSQLIHQPFSLDFRIPQGPDELERFQSDLDGMLSVNGSPDVPISASGPVETLVQNKVGNTTGTFQTEMLSMSLSGTSPFGPFMIRESPTLPSLGQTSITDIGGGQYRIDSFFDVFTELSIDGGASWMPDTSGPARVELNPLPEPASVSLLAFGVLGLAGRRWRRQA